MTLLITIFLMLLPNIHLHSDQVASLLYNGTKECSIPSNLPMSAIVSSNPPLAAFSYASEKVVSHHLNFLATADQKSSSNDLVSCKAYPYAGIILLKGKVKDGAKIKAMNYDPSQFKFYETLNLNEPCLS